MEKTTKLTKKDVISMMLEDNAIKGNEIYVNYLTHELELLNKKRATKDTKVNAEHEELMGIIKDELARVGKAVTISELQKESETLAEYSNQKLSAMFRKLVSNKEVTKIIDKKKSFFTIAE